MRLVHHGGKCCGMRHIFGMGYPQYRLPPYQAEVPKEPHHSSSYQTFSLYNKAVADLQNTFGLAWKECFPQESNLERLKRLLLFCETSQRSGIIEVIVAGRMTEQGVDKTSQAGRWGLELEKLGFENVATHKNSNSSNHIFVWHYKTGVNNPDRWDSKPKPFYARSTPKDEAEEPDAQDEAEEPVAQDEAIQIPY